MSSTRKTVTELLLAAVAVELDTCLQAAGFRRSRRSLKYVRPVTDGKQYLILNFDASPRYAPGALAHLLPHCWLVFPALNERFAEMTGEENSGILTSPTYNYQVFNCAPQESYRQASRWFATSLKVSRLGTASLPSILASK
jgi:hypothetical protein